MSGTSLDGLDLIVCEFTRNNNTWEYRIDKAMTIEYTRDWKEKLISATALQGEALLFLHNEYGTFLGEQVDLFLKKNKLEVELVASHGHTIFHQPAKKLTFQLGSGAAIASTAGITTIADFRLFDVALGGQGAPLVPVGDELLFSNYSYCLNLGGFANISHRLNNQRVACDICPVNIVVNQLAAIEGKLFDTGGNIGRSGQIIPDLVRALNGLDYYTITGPKSLGREWVETNFMTLLWDYKASTASLIRSVYEHIAEQISIYINRHGPGKVMTTGGGAFNQFLVDRIRNKTKADLIIPDDSLVKFKEALVFAFLGLLRTLGEINCLASVTGAQRDTSSGVIYRT
jgi:anhydro-N-acetylmuramic acid kinase